MTGDLGFCGNPFNHAAHNIEDTDGYCAGVGRVEVSDTIVEKYDLITTAQDGTAYVESVADTPQPQFDPVKIPGHYNSGTIEVTNFITDQQLDFPRGNVVKYVSRAGKKDPATEVQDLEKAAAYLQMAHNLANGLPAVVRDPVTKEVVWSLFKN